MKELAALFERDLNKLKQEINGYCNPADIWKTREGISNAAGNLTLHLAGNLRHFVGYILGGIPYERNREKEFSEKNIPVKDLLIIINDTNAAVQQTLQHIKESDLTVQYPVKVFADDMSTGQFLFHLYGHLNYHLGQINYHRRLINA